MTGLYNSKNQRIIKYECSGTHTSIGTTNSMGIISTPCRDPATIFYVEKLTPTLTPPRRYMTRCEQHPLSSQHFIIIDEDEFIVGSIMES